MEKIKGCVELAVCMLLICNLGLLSDSVTPIIGTNVRVLNQSLNQNEPMIAVNPIDHNNLVVGYNDYRTGGSGVSWSCSTDGGMSWTYRGAFTFSGYSREGDPVVAFDSTGKAYFAGLVFNPSGSFGRDGSVFLAMSSDGGRTFNNQKIVAAGSGTASHLDKPWLSVNPANNHVYLTWTRRINAFGIGGAETTSIWYTRSVDGGENFSPPIQIGGDLGSERSFGSQVSAGSGNNVYVSWHTIETGASPSATDWAPPKIWAAESTDGGLSFGGSHQVATKQNSLPNIFISMGTDPARNRIYIAYCERPTYPGDYEVYVASSNSAGGPWSITKVNDVSANDQIWPSLSVAPNGRVDVIWYDFRAGANSVGVSCASSSDFGNSWGASVSITDRTYTPASEFAGDYITIASQNEKSAAVWMDNRQGNQEIYAANVYFPAHKVWNILEFPGGGNGASLALDAGGNPHIMHCRGYFQYPPQELKYTRRSAGEWITDIVVSGQPYALCSFALDSSGQPHVLYEEFESDAPSARRMLKYGRKENGSWTIESVTGFGQNPTFSSLALDSAGNPYIAYREYIYGILMYAYKSNNAWTTERLSSETGVSNISIALDHMNNPHVSYQIQGTFPAYYLKHAYRFGSNWYYETVDPGGSAVSVGMESNIAIDGSNMPRISYHDFTNGDLKYAIKASNGWMIETVESEGNVGRWSSISVDPYNIPHIAYYSNGTLKYARKNSGTWEIETIDGDSHTNVGMHASLALDSLRKPQFAYMAGVTQTLKYAYVASESTQTATGAGPVTFSSNNGQLSNLTAASENSLPTAGKPAGVTFPFGFFSWTITGLAPGQATTVTMNFPSNIPSPAQFWKVIGGAWTNVSSLLGHDNGDNILTLTVTDGGLGDADGLVNGQVSDPGSVAVVSGTPGILERLYRRYPLLAVAAVILLVLIFLFRRNRSPNP